MPALWAQAVHNQIMAARPAPRKSGRSRSRQPVKPEVQPGGDDADGWGAWPRPVPNALPPAFWRAELQHGLNSPHAGFELNTADEQQVQLENASENVGWEEEEEEEREEEQADEWDEGVDHLSDHEKDNCVLQTPLVGLSGFLCVSSFNVDLNHCCNNSPFRTMLQLCSRATMRWTRQQSGATTRTIVFCKHCCSVFLAFCVEPGFFKIDLNHCFKRAPFSTMCRLPRRRRLAPGQRCWAASVECFMKLKPWVPTFLPGDGCIQCTSFRRSRQPFWSAKLARRETRPPFSPAAARIIWGCSEQCHRVADPRRPKAAKCPISCWMIAFG